MKNNSTRKLLLATLLLFAPATLLLAQTKVKVWGQVTDANGPMAGASVIENGTTNGATTDAEGRYALSVGEGATLVFSFIGYVSQEMAATPGEHNVMLAEESTKLDDVVVVGYGVQKKSSVTGAISQVKPEDMQNRSITNAQAALQGKTAGVQIIQGSSAPGASPTVRVRGFSSNVSSNPLYVVDGVRLSDISGIDPNDIASMEVLKDAASAAIYGAEAGNGVVLVTTKKGAAGKGKLTYDFQYSWQTLANVPKVLNAEQYIDYMTEGSILSRDFLLSNWDGATNTSWTDVAFETSTMQKHNVAFTNGNEQGNYYLSLSYLDNDGIVKGDADTYKRLTATVNGEYQIKPWLKVGSTNQLEKYDMRTVAEGNEYGSLLASVLLMDPLTPDVYAPNNLPMNMLTALNNGQPLLKDGKGNYYSVSPFFTGEFGQPLIMRDNNVAKSGGFNVTGSLYGDFKPVKGLVITSRLGYRLSGTRTSTVSLPSYNNSERINPYLGYSAGSSTSIYYQWENFANYARTFGRHSINAMIGMSFQKSSYNYVNGSLTGNEEDALKKNDPIFWYLNYAAASATKAVSGEETESAKLSYFGRVGYEFAGRYMIQASLRADAADLAQLPSTNRWGYFPSVSGAWRISEEPFMQDVKHIIDGLKLRASYGTLGNQNLAGGDAASYYPTTQNLAMGQISMNDNIYSLVTLNTLANPDIKWETTTMLDVGVDFSLFNKLNITADWYRKETKDILMKLDMPLGIGLNAPYQNAGKVRNTGWEVSVVYNNQWRDFSFGVQANLSDVKNEILDMRGKTSTSGVLRNQEGYSIGSIYALKSLGIIRTQEEADWVNANCPQFKETVQIGDIRYADIDGNNSIDENDKDIVGSTIPRYTYSLNLNFGWKGLRLGLLFQGVGKTDGYLNTYYVMPSNQGGTFRKEHLDWASAENPNGKTPRLTSANKNNWYDSSFWMKSAAYLRLKNIQLGYELPKSWMHRIGLNSAYLYVNAQNLFTVTNFWDGYDPEVGYGGDSSGDFDVVKLGSANNYPQVKIVTVGLELKF